MQKEEVKIIYAESPTAWRTWLEKFHQSEQAVWLVFYTKASGKPTLTWSEAVDVALCFGWIDSKKVKASTDSAHQLFSRRKPKSTWSKINKAKLAVLIEKGLLTESGYRSIEIAKQNGSWTILDEVEELIIPNDLHQELNSNPDAFVYFLSLSRSVRKAILQWLVLARRAETRIKRMNEIVEAASKCQRPKHLQ